jgi:CubicO group peptidase (beta-lactamase class C family)
VSKLIRILRNIVIGLFVFYLALFGLTKAIRYPEPIAAIKLGLAPASKTPDLLPGHWVKAEPRSDMAWSVANSETPTVVTWDGEKISFDEFLAKTNTNAFIIIRNGEITFEKYLNGKSKESRLPSYSEAKTLTSIMIGQLISQGKLKESDTFVSILPEFKNGTSFDKVTIQQLLDMQSGISVSDNYPSGPSGWGVAIAQMYASTDLNWFLKHNRKMAQEPGTHPEYRSVDTQLLGMIIHKVTGMKVADYFSENVWKPIGAEYDAFWNVDHVGGQEKTFCCFNAAARDYARIGQMLLNPAGIKINSKEIISPMWMKRLTNPVTTLDHNWGYSAQVWHPFPGTTMLLGLHGQYVYTDPNYQVVIVKLSDEPTDNGNFEELTAAVLKEISEQN